MRDKDIVALLTLASLILYFLSPPIIKFMLIAFILLFSPGYFAIKSYREVSEEEALIFSVPLSIGISGIIAVLLSSLSLLSSRTMLLSVGIIILILYIFSKPLKIEKIKIRMPDRIISVLIILMLVTALGWIYAEQSINPMKEVDIAIEEWPHNATLNSTLEFLIYVKNWNYEAHTFKIIFSLNNVTMEEKTFSLEKGKSIYLHFEAYATHSGINLASFDLYVNGDYYTNVHVYFEVKKAES